LHMRLQIPFSVLDLSTLRLGETPREALQQKVDLARRVEALGFKRFWLAEHHGVLNACWGVSSKKLPGNTMPIFFARCRSCKVRDQRDGESPETRSDTAVRVVPNQGRGRPKRREATARARLIPICPFTEIGCKATVRFEPPIRTFAPRPAASETSALAPT
jgi:hypothetical protein